MNNIREKFEAWLVQEIGEHAENNDKDMIKYLNRNVDIIYKGWQAATEQSQKEIEALQAREKVLVDALESILETGLLEGSYDLHTKADKIAREALATVRGE